MAAPKNPVYISVDIETTGLVPGTHAIVELGAQCLNDGEEFDRDLMPFFGAAVNAEAMRVNGIEPTILEMAEAQSVAPGTVMIHFMRWVLGRAALGTPVFVGWNAAFDWMFLCWYFGRYGVPNPFHHAVLDIKALASGVLGIPWEDFNAGAVRQALGLVEKKPEHRALADARDQAEIFHALLKRMKKS